MKQIVTIIAILFFVAGVAIESPAKNKKMAGKKVLTVKVDVQNLGEDGDYTTLGLPDATYYFQKSEFSKHFSEPAFAAGALIKVKIVKSVDSLDKEGNPTGIFMHYVKILSVKKAEIMPR